MANVFIIGRNGRMGTLIEEEAKKLGHDVVGGVDQENKVINFDLDIDIAIDFSLPAVLFQYLDDLIIHKIPVISGTTGFTQEHMMRIKEASEFIPIMHATNYSIGVNALIKLVKSASEILKDKSEVEIIEKHHRYKKDSPSGTAVTLGETVAKTRQEKLNDISRYGRNGIDDKRESEIAFHSLRGGNIIGDHTVEFIMENEIVSLRHEALNRSIFAEGAVSVINFLSKKKSGFYHVQDAL